MELVADFDTDGIRGTVDGFRSLSGAELGELSVVLEKTAFTRTGAAFSGATSAGVPGHGAWGGRWADSRGEYAGGTFGFAADDESVAVLGAFQACHCASIADGHDDDTVASGN